MSIAHHERLVAEGLERDVEVARAAGRKSFFVNWTVWAAPVQLFAQT